jgi:HAE1 family hydrophobic/amphiphilic exporter-1
MLCARALKSHHEGESQNIVLRIFEAMFKAWLRGYEVTLDIVLKYRFTMAIVMIGTLVGTVWLYIDIPKGFFPVEDTGFVNAVTEGPSDISFKAMYNCRLEIADALRSDPAVAYLNSTVGAGGPNSTDNYGRFFVALKSRSERKENSTAVIQRLRAKTSAVTGMATYFQNVQNINISGRISKSEFQYTLRYSEERSCGESERSAHTQ